MRIFTYHNRSRLKRIAMIAGGAVLILALLLLGWLQYLQRYVVYTGSGIKLDVPGLDAPPTQSQQALSGEFVVGDPVQPPIVAASGEETIIKPLNSFTGVSIDYSMLQSLPAVRAALDDLEAGSAVMLDMKSIYGRFYYNSALGAAADTLDIDAIAALIDDLRGRGCRLIARIPAYRDSAFALANQPEGLALSNGALWMDKDGCYWLNPASELVQAHLLQICQELSAIGFDEVVLSDCYFPESANIAYAAADGRSAVATQAAQALLDSLSASAVIVSFEITDCTANYPAATGATRRYLALDAGSEVAAAAAAYTADLDVPAAQLVFLTDSRDTRFDAYCYLRPLLETE
ncbi:MAG: putative glycoside hydrolase [Oscillospiraceae bacterium]|nr:putative glycoside hydrolase [Oscillospiraceae bacterium]